MPHLVIVLGAGASKPGGCPIMNDFFEVARSLGERKLLGPFNQDYVEVEKVRDIMQTGQHRCRFDVNNLESVLNAIDAAIFTGGLGSFPSDKLKVARACLLRLITGVLLSKQEYRFRYIKSDGTPNLSTMTLPSPAPSPNQVPVLRAGPTGYDELCSAIKRMKDTNPLLSVDIITFNYDCGFEVAAMSQGLYCHYTGESSWTKSIGIFKLHGSINWAQDYLPESPRECMALRGWVEQHVHDRSIDSAKLGIENLLPHSYLGHAPIYAKYVPLIIPPSEDKSKDRGRLSEIWRTASQSLSKANAIAVSGYSLPGTDQFVRQFFLVSNASPEMLRSVILNDRCDDVGRSGAIARWSELFTESVRERATRSSAGFAEFHGEIYRDFESRGFVY